MAPKTIRLADLPGVRPFLDAVAALLDTVNAEDVPPAVEAAADRVRAEALGLGNGPEVTVDDERSPAVLGDEEHIRTAMNVARENPGREVTVDWLRET